MSKWRPEGWINPYITKVSYKDSLEERTFEVGADAMLKAISAEIEKVRENNPYPAKPKLASAEYYEANGYDRACQEILALLK